MKERDMETMRPNDIADTENKSLARILLSRFAPFVSYTVWDIDVGMPINRPYVMLAETRGGSTG